MSDDDEKCEVCGSGGEVHCRGMRGGQMLCTACAAEVVVEFNIAAEVFDNGMWRSCSGCHELNEGHPTGPFSTAFRCNLGVGCRECGGIGAVWEQFLGDPI